MSKKSFYKINQFIQAPQMRILDEFNKQVGVFTRDEAFSKAKELGMDLIELAPGANPPVVKMINFAKFKYQQQQKINDDKKKSKQTETKEIWFTPFIAKGDFEIRIKKAREYLEGGDKVKLVVKYKGREITKKDFGDAIFARSIHLLDEISKVEIAPRLLGKTAFMQLSPVKKKKTDTTDPVEERNV